MYLINWFGYSDQPHSVIRPTGKTAQRSIVCLGAILIYLLFNRAYLLACTKRHTVMRYFIHQFCIRNSGVNYVYHILKLAFVSCFSFLALGFQCHIFDMSIQVQKHFMKTNKSLTLTHKFCIVIVKGIAEPKCTNVFLPVICHLLVPLCLVFFDHISRFLRVGLSHCIFKFLCQA